MTKDESKLSRIIENAIEIADGNLTKLQDHFENSMGRASIIENYIVPWAYEAEEVLEKSFPTESGKSRRESEYIYAGF